MSEARRDTWKPKENYRKAAVPASRCFSKRTSRQLVKPDTYSMRGEIQLISYNDSISSEDERNDEIDLGTIKVKLHPEVVEELLTTKKVSQAIRITYAESHGFVVSGGWIRKPLPDSVSPGGITSSSAFLSVEVTYGRDKIVQEESNWWTWYPSEDVKGLYAVLDRFDDEEELTESVQDTLKADVVAYFTAKMPEEVQRAWANASANLMHGPSAGEGTFQSNTAIVKEWADANIFDVYYDEQTGEVMTDEPQGFEDGDEWVEPGEYWQIDGYDAKRWVFGELARYV